MPWIYLTFAIAMEVVGTSALKMSDGFTRLSPSLVVIGGYGLSFYLLALALRHIPVGAAYAVWSGMGVVFITLIGRFYFGQRLETPALAGIAFIIVGVVMVQVFSGTDTH